MKFGVIVFPGSNCDDDMVYALETIMNQKVVKLWHKENDLKGCDFIMVPGGFSYGDYLRSGAIARFSPIMTSVIEHANKGGYVMGVCNGFQILTEAGLLPGALIRNSGRLFICQNQFIKPVSKTALLTKNLDFSTVFNIPIAHGDGRYYADNETIKSLEDNDQILFHYSDKFGNVNDDSNPNGSLKNIAGVSNKTKNVFGMMPHPERAVDSDLKNTDGQFLFASLLNLTLENI
ncbi:MAG: phosphoribosylformylglycinamidine synthase subunit PurQ [Cytophagales bacterium]|nr:MAG: phosphoribosylformylglycinamidine synthase subunit PurQ [Cytophagales bacterium]